MKRCVISISLFLVTLLMQANLVAAQDGKLTLSELHEQRTGLAQRQRRIIFNNDGDDIIGIRGLDPNTDRKQAMATTPEGLLKLRTAALAGSQVDTIFYHSTYGMRGFIEDSAFRTIYEYPDTYGATDNLRALIENCGRDAMEVMVDWCRQQGVEIFYSNRMNDVHDWYFPKLLAHIKVRHPQYTIGHARAEAGTDPAQTLELMRKGKGPHTGLNFGVKVIRDLTVDAMREVCRNYDIDGIDLDYFRSPRVFPEVGPEQIEQLTDMMRRIRVMTEEEGLRRGRPILVSTRAINSPGYSLKSGLDVRTWLAEGLIDMLTMIDIRPKKGSPAYIESPLKELIDLAHEFGVLAYPNLRRAEHRWSWWICRGEAMSRFAQGADGITTFNRFDPTHRRWRELGDPEVLRDLPKTYTCPYYLPVTVTDQDSGPMPLFIPEDLAAKPPKSLRTFGARQKRMIQLRLRVNALTAGHALAVELNGEALEPTSTSAPLTDEPQKVWLEFSPVATLFKIPENRLVARVAEGEVTIDDVALDVFYVD